MSALITAPELKTIMDQPNVKILDASFAQPPFEGVIGKAQYFDIDDIADINAPLSHTIPSAEVFADKVGKLGISNNDLVIVYDRAGIHMAAARAWWMFRLFGHDNVKVLNGGLNAWLKEGYLVDTYKTAKAAIFKATYRPELVKFYDDMEDNAKKPQFDVLDARDNMRFLMGSIPHSSNMPFAKLMNNDGTLKSIDELRGNFNASSKSIACTCGSGVTACVVALALFELGKKDVAVYDGSWTEWSKYQ